MQVFEGSGTLIGPREFRFSRSEIEPVNKAHGEPSTPLLDERDEHAARRPERPGAGKEP